MTKKGDISLEFSIIKTLISNKPTDEIKSKILGNVNSSSFAFNETSDIWNTLMREYIEEGKKIPSLSTVINNPYISDKSKLFLKKKKYHPLCTLEDAEDSLSHLKEYSDKRKLAGLIEKSADSLSKGIKTREVMSDIDSTLFEIRTRDKKNEDFTVGGIKGSKATKKLTDKILSKETDKLSPTGFKQLDKLLDGGSASGELITITANTGGGKTAAAFNLLKHVYSVNHENVSIVELEMKNREVYERLLSNLSGVPYKKIKSKTCDKKERNRIRESRAAFDSIGEKYNCQYTMWSPKEDVDIHQILAPLSNTHQRWVIIDYINLLKMDNDVTEAQALSSVARYAKRWAQGNNCTVVILTQLDEKTRDIRYSRAIKEHSNIWIWWSYGEEDREAGYCEWNLAKSRSSTLGSFAMDMELSYMRVKDRNSNAESHNDFDEEVITNKKNKGDKEKEQDFNELTMSTEDF